MTENIDLSIIIPHYNTPKLLEKLLNSIPEQNNVEIIVVDDNSDERIEILNDIIFKDKYKHIQFIKNHTKTNAGSCRNIGLENAQGKWVLFADSDDYFIEGFYQHLIKFFESDYDVVFFPPTSIYIDTGEKSDRHIKFKRILNNYINNKSKEAELKIRYSISSPISKLIKRNLLLNNNIKFDEVIASNDKMFSTKVGYYMEKFYVSQKVIYCITRNKGSLTVNKNEKIFDSRVNVNINQINFLKEKLNKNQLKNLKLTREGYIYFSLRNYGLKKCLNVCHKLLKNNIKLFDCKLFNPLYLIKKIKRLNKKKKNNEKYYIN